MEVSVESLIRVVKTYHTKALQSPQLFREASTPPVYPRVPKEVATPQSHVFAFNSGGSLWVLWVAQTAGERTSKQQADPGAIASRLEAIPSN